MSMYLDRGWFEGKYFISGSLCVPIHVDQNVDSIGIDTISRFPIVWNLREEGREGGRKEGREGRMDGRREKEGWEGGGREGGKMSVLREENQVVTRNLTVQSQTHPEFSISLLLPSPSSPLPSPLLPPLLSP